LLISTLRWPEGLRPKGHRNLLCRARGGAEAQGGNRVTMIRVRSIAIPIAALAMSACLAAPLAAAPAAKDVLKIYADIAAAGYTDSADTARPLKLAVDGLIAKPTEDNLRAARAAWIAARIPYMQTEAYRFGNAIVDDWEGK